jgi:hypothetical protein
MEPCPKGTTFSFGPAVIAPSLVLQSAALAAVVSAISAKVTKTTRSIDNAQFLLSDFFVIASAGIIHLSGGLPIYKAFLSEGQQYSY